MRKKPVVPRLKEMLSIDEAAKYIGIGRNKMQKLVADNKVRAIRMGPKLIRIRTDALDQYLAKLEK